MTTTVSPIIQVKSTNALNPHRYKKTENHIYETKDYSMFAFSNQNRDINKNHLRRLIDSMKSNYLFTVILVNSNFEVIDGQHRLEACRTLGLTVYFMIAHNYGLKEMQTLNLNAENWNHQDYLSGYVGQKKQDYIDYARFKKKYQFGHRETIILLADDEVSNASKSEGILFNQGHFKIKDYGAACRIADKIWETKPYFSAFKTRGFVVNLITLMRYHNKFKMDEFIKKCELIPSALKKCGTSEQYLDMIEYVYNYRRVEKVSLKY